MEDVRTYLSAFATAVRFHFIRFKAEYLLVVCGVILCVAGIYEYYFSVPDNFPDDVTVAIPEGSSLPAIAQELAQAHVIAHPTAFSLFVRLIGQADHINAGRYRFHTPQDTFIVALRLVHAESGIPIVRITFPEGSTNADMAALVHAQFADISTKAFLSAAAPYEGYLFPDTYEFTAGETLETIIERLQDTFNKKITALQPTLVASPHSLSDIMVMASLVEAEARTTEDRVMVAGILWNRIKIGMPLQVDAVFGYIFHRDIYSPSLADLKTKSPYNTYLNKGLPPTPINNPGLDAITAAALPAKTGYLYYLTGNDGKMHYAKTFAEHQTNRKKYLK